MGSVLLAFISNSKLIVNATTNPVYQPAATLPEDICALPKQEAKVTSNNPAIISMIQSIIIQLARKGRYTNLNIRLKNSSLANAAATTMLSDKNNPVHIAIWRQKERVRIYVNEQKLWDVPKAATKDAKFNAIVFSVTYAEEVVKHFIGNLRLAIGAPEVGRNCIIYVI
jgi:hypothetical protein